jgi:hypothetical protein
MYLHKDIVIYNDSFQFLLIGNCHFFLSTVNIDPVRDRKLRIFAKTVIHSFGSLTGLTNLDRF